VLELGRNKFEGAASEFQDLEKAFWVGQIVFRLVRPGAIPR
jgi:hypothetical protein